MPGALVSAPDELHARSFADRIMATLGGHGAVRVAEVDGVIVGHGALTPMSLRAIAHVARLDLCVHPGYARQGHGAALLAALLAWADATPTVHKVELLVRASNTAARALYARAGFVEEGRLRDRVRLPTGGFVDDVAMARLTGPASSS